MYCYRFKSRLPLFILSTTLTFKDWYWWNIRLLSLGKLAQLLSWWVWNVCYIRIICTVMIISWTFYIIMKWSPHLQKTFVIIILVTKYMTKIHYHYLGNGISSFWWSIWPIRDHYQIFNLTKKVDLVFHWPKNIFFGIVFCVKLWTFDYLNVRFRTFLRCFFGFC